MKENITAFEGTLHKLTVNVSGVEDFSDYLVYGAAQPYGCSKCAHFEVVTKTEGTCEMIIPALSCGIYKYQLFIKRISTNQEFLILEGEINVKDRLCDCSATTSNDETSTIVDATFSADTVEVNVSIQEGAEGKPGPQGPAGGVNEEEMQEILEPYATKEYVDAQMATVENTVQQVIENTKSDGYLTREDKMKMVQEYYGIDLSHYKNWVIYNEQGGIDVIEGEDIYMADGSNSNMEKWDAKGNATYIHQFYGKEVTNFTLAKSYTNQNFYWYEKGTNGGISGTGNYHFIVQGKSHDNPNLIKLQYKDCETENTLDFRNLLEGETTYNEGITADCGNNYKLENIKIISNGDELVWCNFSGCKKLKTIDCNCSLKYGLVPYQPPFSGCESLIEVPNFNFDNATYCDDWFLGCKSLQSFDKSLPNLVSGNGMFRDCKSLKTFTIEMPKLIDMREMFRNTGLTSWSIEIPNEVTFLDYTFENTNLESFVTDLSKITSMRGTFQNCKNLKSFDTDLSSVTAAKHAFAGCTNLTSFNCELPNLKTAEYMFSNSGIENFDKELPNVTSIERMFAGCKSLKNVILNLPSLGNNGYLYPQHVFMGAEVENCSITIPNYSYATDYFLGNNSKFENCNYTYGGSANHSQKLGANCSITNMVANYPNVTGELNSILSEMKITTLEFNAPLVTKCRYLSYQNPSLTTFNGDISSLEDGYCAFEDCSNLTSFNCELPNLKEGASMFYKCKLDADSVERILTSIPERTNSPQLTIGIKRSAVAKLREITGGGVPSTSYGTLYKNYKGWRLYVVVEEEDL